VDLPGEDRGAEPGAGTDTEAGSGAGDEARAGAEPKAAPRHEFIHPLQARAAGEQAMRAAEALMAAGDLKAASQAMNLAERLLGAARALEALPLPVRADPENQRRQEEAAGGDAAHAQSGPYRPVRTGPQPAPLGDREGVSQGHAL